MRRTTQIKNMNKSPKVTIIRPSSLAAKRTSSTELRVLPKRDAAGFKSHRSNHIRDKDDFANSERKRSKNTNNNNSKLGKSSSKIKLSNQGYTYGSVRVGDQIQDNNPSQVFQQFPKVGVLANQTLYQSERNEDEDTLEKLDGPAFGIVNILHDINHTGRKATLQDLLTATEEGTNKSFPGSSSSISQTHKPQSISTYIKTGKPNSVEHFIVQKQVKKVGIKPVKVRHLSKLNSFEFDILNGKDTQQNPLLEEDPSGYDQPSSEFRETASPDSMSQNGNYVTKEIANSVEFQDSNQCFNENSPKLKNGTLSSQVSRRVSSNSNSGGENAKVQDETLGKNGCFSCKNILQKLKSQQLSYRNLQRQNGSLENIISQKRTLVEQLSKQVKYLIREYHQLARSAGITPILDEKSLSKISSSTCILKNITDTSLTSGGIINVAEILKTVRNESTNTDSTSTTVPDQNNNTSNANSEYLKDLQRQLSSLQETCDVLQEQLLATSKDSTRSKRFLTDLLYTLNTRGYESVTEHDGNEIDLRRCKGEQLLVLKGKDNRQKSAQKKMAPQDLFMKAIIGSQERAIQTLLQQLDNQQRDLIMGNLLSSETVSTGDPDGNRSAALEGEILSLVNLMEGACQRNPDVFTYLKEQYYSELQARDNAGMKSSTSVMEIVLERCQRIVSANSPPKPIRVRSKGDNPTGFPTPRNTISSNRSRDTRDNTFAENMDQIAMKMDLYNSVDQNTINSFADPRNRSAYYPQAIPNAFGAPTRSAAASFVGYNVGPGGSNLNDSANGDMFTNVRFNTNNRLQSPGELLGVDGLTRRNMTGSSLTNPFNLISDEFESYEYEMH